MKQTKKEVFVFNDLFDVDELQNLQNMFSEAHDVASIITLPDGTPITKPCRFSRFCFSLVRQTKKGVANCLKSDAEIGKYNPDGPTIQKCLSAGLWDAGVSINVGGVHIANWLIGQVRNEEIETSKIENYAHEIGADSKELLAAYQEVPEVSVQKFKNIANLLYVFVNQISDKAYKNYLLKKEIEQKKAALEELERHEKQLVEAKNEIQIIADNAPSIIWKLETSLTGEIQSAFISDIADELLDLPKGTVNNNIAFYFTLVRPEYLPKINDEIQKAIGNPSNIISIIYPIKKGNGEIAWFESTGRAYAEEDKFLIFGNTIDITTQKQAEKELLEAKESAEISRERFELAMQVTLDGPYDWNLITNEIYFSDRWKEILGYQPNELTNDFANWERLTKPEDVKRSWDLLEKNLSGELDKFEIEIQMQHKKGHWVDILSRAIVYFNADGKASRFVGTHIDITESKRAKKQLIENEERFRTLIEHLPSGIAIYKPVNNCDDFEFIQLNKAAEKITQEKRENLLGATLLQKFPNMLDSPLHVALKHVCESGEDQHIKPFYYEDEQRKGWRENSIYKLYSGEIVAIFRDVTDLKNAEQKLKLKNKKLKKAKALAEQNEARFRALHDASFGGISIHKKGRILDCNQGLSDLTQYTHEELLGMDGLLLIDKEFRESVLEKINTNETEAYEVVGLRKNGETYPLRIQGTSIPFQGKQVRVTEFRDISEIKKTEQELIQAKENAEDSQYQLNERIKELNGIYAFGLLTERSKDTEKIFKEFVNSIAPQSMQFPEKTFVRLEIYDKLFCTNIEFKEKSTTKMLSAAINVNNNVIGKLSVCYIDNAEFVEVHEQELINAYAERISKLTEQNQWEQKLLEAKAKAEESDRLKSAFLANMSHEIRTPMNGILGFTSLLEDPELSGDQKHVYIDIIKKSGDRLLNTVNDIIEISKIETGQVTLAQKKLNLKEYLQTLCSFFALEAQAKNISIQLEVNLSESEIWIKTDETKLTSILNNLIKNAIKYSNEGEIIVTCKNNGSMLQFDVSDTGIGIPEDRIEAIFDRFVQADIEDKNVHEGSGLGLAITKSYVEMLGGEIQVTSELSKGSVFSFTIKNNPTTVVRENKTEKKMEKNTIGNKTILLVEDDKVSYQLTKSILAKLSYNLIWKENGNDAIELLRNETHVDLVLMDLKLPGMGGLEATESIREFNTTVPIIAQTAYALEGDKEKCMAAGCTDYISKPINRVDLISLIKKYMNLKV